jgi:8-oxo-dGTP pyrophosphatase MutT (NUDIX family)
MARKTDRRGHDQVAALPWRRDTDGAVQVLLITSRETRRWVIPKGWPMKGKTPAEAAAQEAYEEAGVLGVVEEIPLGRYVYEKRAPKRKAQRVEVTVFPLEVLVERAAWPEHQQREKRWLPATEAADLLEENDLQTLVAAFDERQIAPPTRT